MRRFLSDHRTGVGIAASAVLLAAILFLSVNIKTITVTGSSHYSQQQIEEILFSGRWGKNSLYSYINARFRPHRQIPFVEDYKIVFHSPFHAEVILYEKSIIGYVIYMSSYMYFDRDGIIVESSGNKLEGVPWVTGMDFGQIVLYKPLPVENHRIFGEILNLTQQLAVHEIAVDRIQFDPHGQAVLFIDQMEVTLGDNTEIDGKISTLKDMLRSNPQLSGIRGTLELEKYSESNSGAGVTFKRK